MEKKRVRVHVRYLHVCARGCKCPLLPLTVCISSAWASEFLWLKKSSSTACLCVCFPALGVVTWSTVVLKLGFRPLYLLRSCPGSYTISGDGEAQLTDYLCQGYFSLSSSSFFVLIVAAKWKMYEFFKLATDSCSRTFLTKGRGRWRLKGMLIASLLTESGCWGSEPALRLCRWGQASIFWWPWAECLRKHCQRLLQDKSPLLRELLLNGTFTVQLLPDLHHTRSPCLVQAEPSWPWTLLMQTSLPQLISQPGNSPAPSPWLCPDITGLCLTLGTLISTDSEPHLQADVPTKP